MPTPPAPPPGPRRAWQAQLALLFALQLVASSFIPPAEGGRGEGPGLRVALHAQVSPGQGFVVGSVITTAGLEEAFRSREDVEVTRTFYPFEYRGLHDHAWDLVVIEGWFPMINSFIHEVRAVSPSARVLFYCLDPDFPGLDTITALDVDGFLTNSKRALATLNSVAPTLLLPLAVSSSWRPVCQGGEWGTGNHTSGPLETGTHHRPGHHYDHLHDKVVYVGSAVAMTTKALLPPLVRAVVGRLGAGGLFIYGHGWEGVEEFKPYWQGVLPQEDLCCVYSQAMAVLGMTMDGQREAGMVNNRVFEALACQARFISEHFSELEDMFGSHIRYIHEVPDVVRHLDDILVALQPTTTTTTTDHDSSMKASSRDFILSHHTYSHRVEQILDFVSADLNQVSKRSGALRIGIIHESRLQSTTDFQVTLQPAVASLQQHHVYRLEWIPLENLTAIEALDRFDALWVISGLGGRADVFARESLPPPSQTPRGITQRRCLLLLWEDNKNHSSSSSRLDGSLLFEGDGESLQTYDVIYYRSEYERRCLEGVAGHPSLQHAYGLDVPLPPPPPPAAAPPSAEEEGQQLPPPALKTTASALFVTSSPVPSCKTGHVAEAGGAATATAAAAYDGLVVHILPNPDLPGDWASAGRGRQAVVAMDPTGDGYDLDTLMYLFQHSQNITFATGSEAIVQLAPWVVVAVAAATRTASLQPPPAPTLGFTAYDERLIDMAMNWPVDWDLTYYHTTLVAGMTRALCLGRGRSRITIISPANQSLVLPPHPNTPGTTWPMPVEVSVQDFALGQDGSWCLLVCDRVVTCPQRDDITLALDIQPSSTSPAIISLRAELRSNIYLDVVARADPVYLFVPAVPDKRPELQPTDRRGAYDIVHRVDLDSADFQEQHAKAGGVGVGGGSCRLVSPTTLPL